MMMEYTEKSALPLIESTYEDLTATEKQVADYFLEKNELHDFSLKHVAAILNVSEATLVRFSKKIGFKGYREFIYQYEKSLAASKPNENVTESSLQVLNAYQDLLTKTYSLIREEQIGACAKMISQANRIYVMGIGSSGYAAREMAYRFMRVGLDIEAFDDIDMIRMISVIRKESDLVIVLSLSGSRQELLESLRVSHERGAKTMMITSSRYEYLNDFVDEVIVVPSLLHLNHGNLISPQFPLLVMIDILYAACMRYNRDEKRKFHEKTVEVIDRSGQMVE